MNTETATVSTTISRKNKVMPTVKQRRVARLMVDTAMGLHPELQTQADIVLQAGYSKETALVPNKVLNTSGVHEALADIGFNEETAKSVVYSILTNDKAKDSDRLKAGDMVFKVHGTYAAEKHMTLNIDANIDTEAMLALAERLRNATT